MDTLKLRLEPRTITGKKVKHLRKEGLIPASICGKGIANANFQLDAKTFGLVYRVAGRTTLIELETPSGRQSAFVRQAQIHPVSRQYIHVDFRVVDLRTELTADVPVQTVGENRLVERGEAVLSVTLPTLHVRALPGDLPAAIEVDISNLELGTSLHVSDLHIASNITVLTPADQSLLTLAASRMAQEDAAITEQEQLGEPELAGQAAEETPAETTDQE